MKLTNANTSSNEVLSVRANILSELRDSLGDFAPFAQALLSAESGPISTSSQTTNTYFMSVYTSISRQGSVESSVGINNDGSVQVVQLHVSSSTNINQGTEIVDMFSIIATYSGESAAIGTQTDRYKIYNGSKGEYINSTYIFRAPQFINEFNIDQYLESYAQQTGSVDILVALSNMAVSGRVAYADVISVIGSSGSFVNPKLHGIITQYATYLNEDNACTIINTMISDYFNDTLGYNESNDELSFNSLEYSFDSSCLLGWRQITGIIASAVTIVTSIFCPIAGFIAGAIGAVINSVSDFITNSDQSVPKIVPEAAHNISSLPIWQREIDFNELNWAHKFVKRSGRLTLTTDFFKLFAWLTNTNKLALEMYIITGYDYNIVSQWRNGRQGYEPTGAILQIRNIMNFQTDEYGRSFQTQLFTNNIDGAWNIPSMFGDQSIPSISDTNDVLYSRLFNGLFLCSLYVLYSSRSSIHVVQDQTRSNSLPDYTTEEKLLWFVGAYMDTYAANLLDSSIATWLVPGWYATLIQFANTLNANTMLGRFVNSYFSGTGTSPSIINQDYGKVENIRSFLSSTITSKGSAMIIPPTSKYSIGQKLAITAGVAAIVTVGSLIAAKRFRSAQARNAQDQKFRVDQALATYKADPSTENWRQYQKEIKSFNRWTYFNGAARVSADNWGIMSTSVQSQSSANGDTILNTLLKTEAVDNALSEVMTNQIPSLASENLVTRSAVNQVLNKSETIEERSDSLIAGQNSLQNELFKIKQRIVG